jgi:CRP-like cAMP-binding protein
MKHLPDNEPSQQAIDAIVTFVKRFAALSTSDIDLLVSFLQSKKISKHEYLLREGEVTKNIYFLVEGYFRMYYVDKDGNEINYRFTDKNNFLTDFQSFLTQKPSHFYWQAMQDAEVLVLPYKQVQEAYNASPSWNTFGRLIAEHVYLQMNERVEMLLFMSPEERYLHLMNNQPELLDQISQFQLSSFIGVKPESLSRLRKRLSKK